MRRLASLPAALLFATLTLASVFTSSTAAADKKTELKPIYTTKETAEFQTLTKATLEALNAGKTTEVVEKLTDLETAWDAKEKDLKPRSEKTWVVIDKTLDQAISALRSSKKDPAKGKAALEELVKQLEQATKP